MHDTSVKADQAECACSGFIRKADSAGEIGGKTLTPMNGTRKDDISGAKQAAHEIYKDIGGFGIVGPGGVKADIIGQAARIEWTLARGNDKLCQIAGKVLSGGGGTAITHRENAALVAVTLQQQIARACNGRFIELLNEAAALGEKGIDRVEGVSHTEQYEKPEDRRSGKQHLPTSSDVGIRSGFGLGFRISPFRRGCA